MAHASAAAKFPGAEKLPPMMSYLWVALGSALGGVGRYGVGLIASRLWGDTFPWGTIAINILGSFVIGFFGALTMPDGALPASTNLRVFVMVGICGGFTTFSSFSLQTLTLSRDANWFGAMSNVVLSVVLCLLAVTLGQVSAERLGPKRAKAASVPSVVVAILDRVETAPRVLVASALAAARLGESQSGPVRIEALHVRHEAMQGFMLTEDVMTEARRREISGQASQLSAQLLAIFEAWRQASGSGSWREEIGETGSMIAQRAANADLVVIGRPSSGGSDGADRALRAAIFDVRGLILLVPDTVPPEMGRHIAVAWEPSEAADRAIEAALPLLLRADRVTVLVGREGEAGLRAQPAGPWQKLASTSVKIVIRCFQIGGRAIGEALVAEAHLVNADLLVIGACTHNRFIERIVGGTAPDILANADLPVLLHH